LKTNQISFFLLGIATHNDNNNNKSLTTLQSKPPARLKHNIFSVSNTNIQTIS